MVHVNFVLTIHENIEFYILYNDTMHNNFFLAKDRFVLIDKEFLKTF